MKNKIKRWLSSHLSRLRPAMTGAPPPAFIRVAYHTPRQVVLLTARHGEAENVWPIDWHIPLSLEPQLYAVSLTTVGYGTELIKASGLFVVNFVPATWEEVIFFCGRTSGRAVDKFSEAGLRKEEATSINAPRLADALGFLECRVIESLEVGDHTLYVGQVSHAAQQEHDKTLHHLDHGLVNLKESFEKVPDRR